MTAPAAVGLIRTTQRGPLKGTLALYPTEYQLPKTSNTLRVNTFTPLAHKSKRFA